MKNKFVHIITMILIVFLIVVFNCLSLPNISFATGDYNEDDIVYMIMTDRFPDGDSTNNDQGEPGGEYQPGNLKFYQGGDWQGIINKIPYLKNLGITAIWISPVSDDQDISKDGGEAGYHGYFTYDYYSPNPHFGDITKLKELVSTAHSNGIDVILDVVPNHTGDYLDPFATEYDPPDLHPISPFNNPNWYHHNGDVTDWNNQWLVENGDIGGLDDLNQDIVDVEQEIYSVYNYWFTQTDADAARVDAVRSIPKWFLQSFENSIGLPTFGEAFHGDVSYVSDYQNYEWGVLDFPLFFVAREVFAYDDSFTRIGDIFDQDWKYNDVNKLHTFIDNHDRDRFLALADDNFSRLRLALTFLFTARGIPVIYYGTEQAYYGDGLTHEWQGISNEFNRQVLEDFDESHIIYNHIKRLTEIRNNYQSLRRGVQREMWEDDVVYSYSRRIDTTGEEVITVMTNSWNSQTRTIPLRAESTIIVGTELTNLLNTNDKITVKSGGSTGKQITVSLNAKEAKIYTTDVTENYTPPSLTLTTIRVHYNAGFGNSVWIRGDTYPFWWDKGREARWTDGDVWVWETERIPSGETFEFKPLINDYTLSVGNNYIGTGGTTIDIYPVFRDPAAETTRIRVHYDVGVGNSIYIRGDTWPLSWNNGVQSTYTKGNVWIWETESIPVDSPFEFKTLLNDTTWSLGSNYKVSGGSTIDIYPVFYSGETERNIENIRVYYDVGYGNSIYVRGSTPPLSWNSGLQATYNPQNIWIWETSDIAESTAFEFKLLINDSTWSQGNNYWMRGGMVVEIYPTF